MSVGSPGTERRLSVVWVTFFGLNGILLLASLIPTLRGAEDRYLHQHTRLFLAILAATLIGVQRLEIVRGDRWLRIAIVVTLALQVLLAWR
jgi:hypothetical protein